MQSLSQADCLVLWESGRALHPIDQGLLYVHAAFPESRYEAIADWPLGRRNHALAELHCATFGRWLRGWTACERCEAKLECEVDGHALIASGAEPRTESIAIAGSEFRLPTSRDLAAIAGKSSPADAVLSLLDRCRVSGFAEGTELKLCAWSEAEIETIGDRMAEADPLAEILLHFDCPVCACDFDKSLDLAAFLWAEMEARARRLMLDVHELAMAYGWSEAETLALSPARRNFYLDMVRA
jgi:hypothetical protein